MSIILTGLCWVSAYIFLIFTTLCYAAGLLHAAEFAEEHPTLTGKIIKVAIVVISILTVVVWVTEWLPWWCVIPSLLAHAAYYALLSTFPDMDPWGAPFLSSIGLVVVSHIAWGYHFYGAYEISTLEILSFFFLFVWPVPTALFISLNIEETLPGQGITRLKKKKTSAITAVRNAIARCLPKSSAKKREGYSNDDDTGGYSAYDNNSNNNNNNNNFNNPNNPSFNPLQPNFPLSPSPSPVRFNVQSTPTHRQHQQHQQQQQHQQHHQQQHQQHQPHQQHQQQYQQQQRQRQPQQPQLHHFPHDDGYHQQQQQQQQQVYSEKVGNEEQQQQQQQGYEQEQQYQHNASDYANNNQAEDDMYQAEAAPVHRPQIRARRQF